MAYLKQDLDPFVRGDDWSIIFNIAELTGSPVDISGNTYWMTLKLDPTTADPGNAQQTVIPDPGDAALGRVVVSFPSAVTSLLEPGNYTYDLQQIDISSNVTTLIIGKVRCVRDITISVI